MQVILKLIWNQIVTFFTTKFVDVCKDAFQKSLEAFKEAIWKAVKEDIQLHIKAAIGHVEVYFNSSEARVKEEAILDTLMEWIKLPLLLKPFKKLIKGMIRNKVNSLVEQVIVEAKAKLVP